VYILDVKQDKNHFPCPTVVKISYRALRWVVNPGRLFHLVSCSLSEQSISVSP